MSEENEDKPREAYRLPIELKVEYKRLNSFFADYTRNISRGGTFIRTQKPLNIGTEFLFRMKVPKLEDALVIRGRVQWIVQPDEATEEMVVAGCQHENMGDMAGRYHAMLAVAPKFEVKE